MESENLVPDDLKLMKLHKQKKILNGQYIITRVIGGWIYERQEGPTVFPAILQIVFVPEEIKTK